MPTAVYIRLRVLRWSIATMANVFCSVAISARVLAAVAVWSVVLVMCESPRAFGWRPVHVPRPGR